MTDVRDQAGDVRDGEQLDLDQLLPVLEREVGLTGPARLSQFRRGHSNLTYLLAYEDGQEFVLRRPPFGVSGQGAHDMSREWRVLDKLHPVWGKVPRPVFFCDDHDVLGCDFYLTERCQGAVLRKKLPDGVAGDPDQARAWCELLVDTLCELHAIDCDAAGITWGHPDGYVQRQVEGWTGRYQKAQTDDIDAMDATMGWLADKLPASAAPVLLHNDYKFDNVMLDAESLSKVVAVFDWEMSTRGDPLMDVGTMLSYWVQADDPAPLHEARFGPTHLPGAMTRRELVDRYAEKTGRNVDEILFYYVFGLFKTAVVTQQIYARFKRGLTKDPRFAMMLQATQLLSGLAQGAIAHDKI